MKRDWKKEAMKTVKLVKIEQQKNEYTKIEEKKCMKAYTFF